MSDITPRVDIAFKKIFGVEENKDLLMSLINSIVSTEDQVVDITLLNPYNPRDFKQDKLSVLDIKAKNEKGIHYNIEMQISDEADYDKRALYYWAKLYAEQMQKSYKYDKLEKTIGIHILNFLSIPDSKQYHNKFQLREVHTGVHYFKDIELHTIELSKFEIESGINNYQTSAILKLKNMLDVWTTYLIDNDYLRQAELPESFPRALIKKAISVLEELNFSKKERDNYEAHLKWLRAEASGIKKAEEKKFAEGKAEGKVEERELIAKNLLSKGVDVGLISESTGLSISEIESLSKSKEVKK
jgi:predicted transposase/invertase (TIGR01784 family)